MQIAVLLTGTDVHGRVFSEETLTVILSRHGAGIVSVNKLYPEQELNLRNNATGVEAEIRVVGQIGEEEGRYTYGVAFLDQEMDLWQVPFPPLSASEVLAGQLTLICGGCGALETLEEGGMESDILATNEGIIRHCSGCVRATVWKEAPAGARAASREPVPALVGAASAAPAGIALLTLPEPPPAAAPAPPGPPANRRRYVRARVELVACIRRPGSTEEDIVVCEDMSRGGISFKSHNRYFEQTFIELAVPYTRGGQAIFVSAQIVRVEELPGQGFFRCGVAFSNSGASRKAS